MNSKQQKLIHAHEHEWGLLIVDSDRPVTIMELKKP
jgi:hypothetical protein